MLAVGLATDTGESVALDDALETLTLGGTDNVHELDIFREDVGDREDVTAFFLGVVPAFSKWPFRALLVCFSFFSS